MHIMVVEDEFLVAMSLEDVVIAAGHVCVGPAATVAGALVLLHREPCDLAILDFGLGLDTVEPLCEWLESMGIPFGFASGRDDLSHAPRWKDMPRIAKPFDASGVNGLIDRLIQARSATVKHNGF